MTQGKAILVVDLGNSSTKGKVLYGKVEGTNKYKEVKFEVPNTFGSILTEDIAPTDRYDSDTNTVFHIKTEGLTDAGFTSEVVGTYANGEYQTVEYSRPSVKTTPQQKKVVQTAVVLSCYMAFWKGLNAVAKIAGVNVNDVDISWTVVALLPPQDVKTDGVKLERIFRSIHKLDVLFPECTKDIKIDTVRVLPEGYCAFIGTVFDNGMTVRQGYDHLLTENIAILDIGEGTTDFLVMAKNKLQNNTLKTVRFGGKNVRSNVKASTNFNVNDEDYKTALLTGNLKVGAETHDIVNAINNAKAKVASDIYNDLTEHLEGCGFESDSIYGILVVGGGVMDGDNPAVKPLSEYIMNEFSQFFPMATLIDLPKHTVNKIVEDEAVKVEEIISPRFLNLNGASILAETIARKNN